MVATSEEAVETIDDCDCHVCGRVLCDFPDETPEVAGWRVVFA